MWPFSESERNAVSEAALPVVNAGLVHDAVLRASCLLGLLDVLAGLRERHGEHPALLETEADFAEDDAERIALYRRAVSLAEANGIQTLTIRLSLSRVLLETGQRESALDELRACEGELTEVGDDSDRAEWTELFATANSGTPLARASG